MSRRTRRMLVAATAMLAGLTALIAPAQASVPSSGSRATGSVNIMLSETLQGQMFKGGVFIYDANAVTVGMGSSGVLSLQFPLTGTSTATATSSITVDPETGGVTFYNGPAVTQLGLGDIVVRRTGTTGTVTGSFIGPFDAAAGTQFHQRMTVFTMSGARTTRSGSHWTMNAHLTLTSEAAALLDSMLKTTVFTPGTAFGDLLADVTSR